MSAEDCSRGGTSAGDLFDGDRELARGAAAAAVLLIDAESEQSDVGKSAHVLPGELGGLIVPSGAWSKLGVCELAYKVPQHQLFFCQ